MPISRQQFEAGLTDEMESWIKLVHAFLSSDKDTAYSEEDLRQQVRPQVHRNINIVWKARPKDKFEEPDEPTEEERSGPVQKDEAKPFRAALTELVRLEAVEKKLVAGGQYYIYKQDLPSPE